MEKLNSTGHLTILNFEGKSQPVEFVETMKVTEGVECDVYKFVSDNSKDLGVIKIQPGYKTPLQKVLKGDRTIEGYISGIGKLVISKGAEEKIHEVKNSDSLSLDVGIGETMQWTAGPNSNLIAYEICFPPYEDGRYENLS